MPVTEKFHGTRVFKGAQQARPIQTEDYSTIGALVVAPAADAAAFPLNTPVTVFTTDTPKRLLLGAGGNVDAVWDAIDDQANEEFAGAELTIVRVAEGTGTGQTQLENTMANMVGSGALNSGAHAFKTALSRPKLLIAPGYTSQRVGNQKNPVVSELETIAMRTRGIVIADLPNTTMAAAETYRGDFPNNKRVYGIDPHVLVPGAGAQPVVQPASGRVAGLFVRRDKAEGGPHVSPSNQVIGGIVGVARPISYFDGDPDSEGNWLNSRGITTIIDNGRLWGNETFASDPLDRFVNVVRTEDAIDSAVVKGFRWAMDNNLNVPLAVAIAQSLDAFLTEAARRGWIISGRVNFDPSLNSSASMMSGTLVLEYDREPYAPLNDLQFSASRNPDYYEYVAEGITRAMQQLNARTTRVIYGVNLTI
jgi:phage tail sheath protein FI